MTFETMQRAYPSLASELLAEAGGDVQGAKDLWTEAYAELVAEGVRTERARARRHVTLGRRGGAAGTEIALQAIESGQDTEELVPDYMAAASSAVLDRYQPRPHRFQV